MLSTDKIADTAKTAREIIKYYLDYDFDSTELAFCTVETGPEIAKELYERIRPEYWEEQFGTKNYYRTLRAKAIVGPEKSAVLIRTDQNCSEYNLLQILLHEYGHIFLNRKEWGGKLFVDTCEGWLNKEGSYVAGYSVWREFAADIFTFSFLPGVAYSGLQKSKKAMNKALNRVRELVLNFEITNEIYDMTVDILSILFTTKAFEKSKSWEDFEVTCSNYLPKPIIGGVIEVIYNQIKNSESPFWEIDEDFIEDLGTSVLMMMTKMYAIENKVL